MVHYELLADDAMSGHDVGPEDPRVLNRRSDQSRTYSAHEGQGFMRFRCVQTPLTDHGAVSIASIRPVLTGK